MKRKLRIVMHIGPTGLDDTELFWTDKKEDLLGKYTRGEGQALQFVLENYDCSPNFFSALQDGTLLKDFRGSKFTVNVDRGYYRRLHEWVESGDSQRGIPFPG